jgi:hypothetical protein
VRRRDPGIIFFGFFSCRLDIVADIGHSNLITAVVMSRNAREANNKGGVRWLRNTAVDVELGWVKHATGQDGFLSWLL